MRITFSSLATTCALLSVMPAWAHHSHGNYDMTQFTNLKGKVTEVHWNNPHSWIYLEVTGDKGRPTCGRLKAPA